MHGKSAPLFALLGVLSLSLMGISRSSTYYVDSSYWGMPFGSSRSPFRSIASAMFFASRGDTIIVRPGLYQENVFLKAGVRLVSPVVGAAIIHGGSTPWLRLPAVTGADGATISGFTITGGASGGVSCNGVSPQIRRNIIRGNLGYGIVCRRGADAIIENNTILGNLELAKTDVGRYGIYAEKSSPVIRNNIITGNAVGYAAVSCAPAESYNDIWHNTVNVEGAVRGQGTISRDPKFADCESGPLGPQGWDDFRLHETSPCRDTGDPDPQFNDSDGSRNDMGAFDGDGGWEVSLPAQGYFVESVLGAIDKEEGLVTNGVSRFTSDPYFYFPVKGTASAGEQQVGDIVSQAIPVLTDNQFEARFWDFAEPPVVPCTVVTVTFDRAPQGIAYYQGSNASCLDPGEVLKHEGKSIIGGHLYLPPEYASGFGAIGIETVLHELAHVAGLAHAYRGAAIIARGTPCCLGEYSPYEKEAFAFLYSLSPGTKLSRLFSLQEMARTVLHPFPRIDEIIKWTDPGYWAHADSASPGDTIVLAGSRLSLRWLTESDTTLRPPDYEPPVVYFDDIAVVADMDDQSTLSGGPSRYLQVTVPANATSGWVHVRARGVVSNTIYLEITPSTR